MTSRSMNVRKIKMNIEKATRMEQMKKKATVIMKKKKNKKMKKNVMTILKRMRETVKTVPAVSMRVKGM
jgi:hypothetical protein